MHLARQNSWRQQLRSACFAAATYHIWSERNARRHGVIAVSAVQRFDWLKQEVMLRVDGSKRRLRLHDQQYLQALKL